MHDKIFYINNWQCWPALSTTQTWENMNLLAFPVCLALATALDDFPTLTDKDTARVAVPVGTPVTTAPALASETTTSCFIGIQ